MSDKYEHVESGNVYQCIGAQGVVLEIHTYPDGSASLCTFHRDDTESKLYGLKLTAGSAVYLATLLAGSPPPGVGVN